MIKAVIFDFFSVLAIKDTDSFRKAFFPDDQEKTGQAEKLHEQLNLGLITYDNYISGLANLAGVDKQKVLEHTEGYQPNSEALKYIHDKLKPNYKLGILSNTEIDVVAELIGRTAEEMFDDITLSYKTGYAKPQLEIYQLAAKNLGVKQSECILIDDIESYCQGADRAGMKTIQYRNFEQMRRELESLLSTGPYD